MRIFAIRKTWIGLTGLLGKGNGRKLDVASPDRITREKISQVAEEIFKKRYGHGSLPET
jgi:hypothetical protein